VPALVGYGARRRSAVIHPPIHKHLHTKHVCEQPLEVLVERGVVSVHDDEQLGIRKRSRWKGFEELFLVAQSARPNALRDLARRGPGGSPDSSVETATKEAKFPAV